MANNNPKISIITASYNYAEYIKETIESVLNQDYSNWEMIVVDDGSKDNSIDVIKSYCKKDDRIKLYTHENNINKGLIETIKLGLTMATSEWVAFLESDDTFKKEKLSKCIEAIEKYKDVDFIFTDVELVGDKQEIHKRFKNYFEEQRKIIGKNKYPLKILHTLLKDNRIPTFSCVMLKKELFNGVDFNSPTPPCLDHWLWAQILGKANVLYINEKLTNWTIHNSYIIKAKYDKALQAKFSEGIYNYIKNNSKGFSAKLKIFPAILTHYRKNIFRFSLKERRICLFKKEFRF